MNAEPVVWSNSAKTMSPLISICIPFFRFDVTGLLTRLLRESQAHDGSIEVLLADDASDDGSHVQRLKTITAAMAVLVEIAVFTKNQGRACIRQYLSQQARGAYVLFMDCDMFPDADDFIGRYLASARDGIDDIVVGGCSYTRIGNVPDSKALYYYHSDRTQCVALEERREAPLRYIFTNNMMIRRTLLLSLAFDTGYVGWGYEDTDLAISAARVGARIRHIDNTATHFGLIDDNALIDKYRNSTANYLRLVSKFPMETAEFPVSRAVDVLSRLPLPFTWLTNALERLTRVSLLPLRARYLFLQGMKLSLYSQAMRRASVH